MLAEAGYRDVPGGTVDPRANGAERPAEMSEVLSPETYVGYSRAAHFAGGTVVHDAPSTYAAPASLQRNEWALGGRWTVGAESGVLDAPHGTIVFRFHARDLHLVVGPGRDGKPLRFHVTIDGAPPGNAHGMDTDDQGNGTVTEQRLYQLIRQAGPVADHTFTIEFLDPGAEAFSFTFG